MPGDLLMSGRGTSDINDPLQFEYVCWNDECCLAEHFVSGKLHVGLTAYIKNLTDKIDTQNAVALAEAALLKGAKNKLDSVSKFPVMLRQMWSGTEVQRWLDDRLK